MGDGEEVNDVLAITGEFLVSMREGKGNRSDGFVTGDGPVSGVLDNLGRLNRSKRDLDVSKSLSFEVVIGGRELACEYGVKIDCSSRDNVLPL